jgi:hypothetical protein
MIVYRVTYHDDDSPSGTAQAWFVSMRAAKAGIVELRKTYTGTDGEITGCFYVTEDSPERMDVRGGRAGMVRFLNVVAKAA